ncbi:MAG: hypothetical protein JW891_14440 [Candidatus Lokiarchaeota archaeon]|nr:hypothetical protein [Candidatus Lokiarchaeota archaeon]
MKYNKILNRLYEKIPGIYFGYLGLGILGISVFLALYLYYISDQSYSIFTHWISNLGIGPNGSSLVFNNGFVAVCGLFFSF